MHVSKLPPTALQPSQPETSSSKQRLTSEIAAAKTQDLLELEKPLAPATDRADIRPLDTPGGLLILLAEIRAALELSAEAIGTSSAVDLPGSDDVAAAGPTQTARHIVEWVLESTPEDASDAAAWSASWVRVQSALQGGLEQAISTVSNWREVADPVVDGVKQSIGFVLQALSDESPNPLWLRPEWVGLAPRLERFSRRRRAARRRRTDPDYWQASLDDNDERR